MHSRSVRNATGEAGASGSSHVSPVVEYCRSLRENVSLSSAVFEGPRSVDRFRRRGPRVV